MHAGQGVREARVIAQPLRGGSCVGIIVPERAKRDALKSHGTERPRHEAAGAQRKHRLAGRDLQGDVAAEDSSPLRETKRQRQAAGPFEICL